MMKASLFLCVNNPYAFSRQTLNSLLLFFLL